MIVSAVSGATNHLTKQRYRDIIKIVKKTYSQANGEQYNVRNDYQ